MSDDLDVDTIPTPLQRAEEALYAHILEQGNAMAGDLDLHRLAEVAIAASIPGYSLPDRPVEVIVSIADEAGLEVEQTIRLSREQASRPELLGAALGGAAGHALRAFHVGDDGEAAERARDAAEQQLRNAP